MPGTVHGAKDPPGLDDPVKPHLGTKAARPSLGPHGPFVGRGIVSPLTIKAITKEGRRTMSNVMPLPRGTTWQDFVVALVSIGVELLIHYGKLLISRLAERWNACT